MYDGPERREGGRRLRFVEFTKSGRMKEWCVFLNPNTRGIGATVYLDKDGPWATVSGAWGCNASDFREIAGFMDRVARGDTKTEA